MATDWKYGKWLSNPPPGEEVVITGMSGRLPESNNINEFQNNLFNKKDMVTEDGRRWKLDHPEVPQRNAKIYDIDKIDAGFFGLHHRQADIMDPMMRKFLETAIEAIMDAGLNPSELENTKTGVFVGACYSDMETETLESITQPQKMTITGYLKSFLARRLSYHLKLKGPSFNMDSACSSSFNALETAFRAIRQGKCEYAIVGGTSLLMHPGMTHQFYRLGVLSPNGVCKPFDQDADGYVRSETIACIFLQKSKTAKRIYAQIVYSKVNDDGFKQSGITYPSAEMQENLMTEVLRDSAIKPSDIDFLEAHGTGTQVGDPQEIKAIDCAIAKKRNKPLLIGSVKGNIGHSEPASGLASLIKVIIAMETGYIPPNINLKNIKKDIDGFEEKRLIPITETTRLENRNAVIGINNFGFGGNNVNVLLKRFNKIKKNNGLPEDDLSRLICVSGRTKEAVLVLLEDAKRRSLDEEYVGLLHQLFKKNIANHLYRGYAILAKNEPVISHVGNFSQKTTPLYLFFGDLEQGYKIIDEHLMQFSVFREIKHKILNDVLKHFINNKKIVESDNLLTVIVQIGLLKMLKLVNVQPTAVFGESIGKIASSYYYGDISIEEAVGMICKSEENFSQRFEMFLNKNKFSKTRDATYDEMLEDGNGIFLSISDTFKEAKNEFILTKNGNFQFLEILGRLYLNGHNPQLSNIYPKIKFPVSRATPMISPLIKWDYRKNWYTYKFEVNTKKDIYQTIHTMSVELCQEQKYMVGHIIDGRNLVPAAEYLTLVWTLFTRGKNMLESSLPVVFENCRFVRAINLPETGAIKVLISIQKSNGYFEVTEKDSLLVTGRIFFPEDINKHHTDLPMADFDTDDQTEVLEQDEFYRELYLRGYNYSGLFKGVVKCNVDASVGLVEWENNWTTFIDKMLQLKILQMDTRLLYVPVSIQKLIIDPTKLTLSTNQNNSLFTVYAYKDCNVVKSAGIEIHGIKATSITRRKPFQPVLEKNIFIPNNAQLSLEESTRAITQIILENSLENVFKSVEIVDEFTKPNSPYILPLMTKALNDVPLVTVALSISTKTPPKEEIPNITVENVVLTPTSNFLLIVASKIFQRSSFLYQTLSSLNKNGFILTREDIDYVPEFNDCVVISEYVTGNEKLILFKKVATKNEIEYIDISSEHFEWIPKLQNSLKSDKDIVAYSQSQEPVGLLGLINCIRREPGGNKVFCFFMDNTAPKFNPLDKFYSNQIGKRAAFNIYKDGQWGTYRHLCLEDVNDIEEEHVFVNTLVRGDLSSLRWFQGWLTPKTKLEARKILIYPFYCSVNFRDIMAASGRVTIDALTTERLNQECLLGFEFCGIDTSNELPNNKKNRGRRVIGMTNSAALSTMIIADKRSLFEIPENWSLEDGATVFVVYATVIYSLFRIVKIKPGMSILIHSGTGGVGLAAINVCTYYGCNIFVTVGTQEKKDYLRKHYPQIPDSHIGNSRSMSFEEMIKRETKGRGVDVVLNSLSEEKLRASIRCLAKGGDFIEIGKYDIGIDSPLNLLLVEKNIKYHGVMLDRIFLQSVEIKTWLFKTIYESIKLGYIKPLPRKVFERDEVEKAFRYMMTGKHIGKVLIKIRNGDEKLETLPIQVFKGTPRFWCDPQKSYVIIGGLGGFGLELADWLFLRGVKKLILVSRSGIQNGYQKQRIKIWESKGVTVEISTHDITTMQGCVNLVQEASKLGPIDAIFNLAVVLKDELFENQTQESFSTVLGPKAKATIFLDQVTRSRCPDLKYFVVFSSVSCGRGNVGQTNYGMANSVMERICEKRKNYGFPGLAIQWGAIGDVGLVAKMQKENKELVIGGTLQQKISSCLEVLNKFLCQKHPIVSSMVVAEKNTKNYDFESAVNAVAYILGIKDIKAVGYHANFSDLGLDSMTANELVQILEKDFEIYITTKDVRNLTFAKLMELENQRKENLQSETKMEFGIKFLTRHIPTGEVNFIRIARIPSKINDNQKAPKVFVLPGIDGVFEPLQCLIRNISAHVYGINYKFYNSEDSIEEICTNLLPNIEEIVSKFEIFFIMGYSFGTAVATELVALLEEKGYNCKFLAIEGSVSYLQQAMNKHLTATSDKEFETLVFFYILSLILPTELINEKENEFMKCQTLNNRIELAQSLIPPDIPQKENFNQLAVTILYKRLKSIVHYNFTHVKLKSQTHLFRAKYPMVENISEDYNISEICANSVEVIVIDGDHNSVLNQTQLVDSVNELLNKSGDLEG